MPPGFETMWCSVYGDDLAFKNAEELLQFALIGRHAEIEAMEMIFWFTAQSPFISTPLSSCCLLLDVEDQ
jgi:hypothetical protein